MMISHLVNYAKNTGIPDIIAATFLSALGSGSIVGKITMGVTSNRVGRKPTLISAPGKARGARCLSFLK